MYPEVSAHLEPEPLISLHSHGQTVSNACMILEILKRYRNTYMQPIRSTLTAIRTGFSSNATSVIASR